MLQIVLTSDKLSNVDQDVQERPLSVLGYASGCE